MLETLRQEDINRTRRAPTEELETVGAHTNIEVNFLLISLFLQEGPEQELRSRDVREKGRVGAAGCGRGRGRGRAALAFHLHAL